MSCPYISAAATRAQAQTQADSAQQAEWLENAIVDGPLPIHEPRQRTRIADIRDDDPSAEVLRAAQERLAIANRTGDLLSFANKLDTEWTPCE
jgi:hypothetical protein